VNQAAKRVTDYSAIAAQYDRRYEVQDSSDVERELLDFVGDAGTGPILEVGCGTGHWLRWLGVRDYDITGLDASRAMLDIATAKTPTPRLVQSRAEVLPWADGSFARLYCIDAFHHFTHEKAFLGEAYRVLQPGGGLMTMGLDIHNGDDSWWIYDYFPQTVEIDRRRYLPTGRIRQMMAEAGFAGCRSLVVTSEPWRMVARDYLESGELHKGMTSQLAVLSDDEYDRGIGRVVADIEAAEAEGEVLYLSANLRSYATIGWVA
jgi:SAM-dependent methyltransferase